MITSIQNPLIQQVRNLLNDSRERRNNGLFVLEGVRLIEEAIQSGLPARLIFYIPDLPQRATRLIEDCKKRGLEVEEISPNLLSRISDTEQPQGILAVFPIRPMPDADDLNFVVICDNVRDPGNMGTILRTSAAAGAQAVWLSPGCADPYSPKVLRAAMGAHFHLAIASRTWDEIKADSSAQKLDLYLADSGGALTLWDANFKSKLGIIICNEGDGPSQPAREIAPQTVLIPMPGKFESLNASSAAAVLIFEVVRQRNLK